MTKIEVTASDVLYGIRGKSRNCSIFRAINRVRSDLVSVGVTYANFSRNRHALLPSEAVRFIDVFDNGYRVSPFTFELDIPE